MKYVVVLCEGMSDEPLDELEGRTPLALAKSSHMDTLARVSEVGMVHNVPKGTVPDTSTADLAILGYDCSLAKELDNEESKNLFEDFYTKTGKRTALIAADENLRKIASMTDMTFIEVEGATGTLNTNFAGKKDAAISALFDKDYDLVIIHVKGLDEVSRSKSVEKKVHGIENIDAYLIGPLIEELQGRDVEFRILIMPDVPTYVRLGSSTSDAVPYMLYDSGIEVEGCQAFLEKYAKESGICYDDGYSLLSHLLEDN